MAIISDNNGLVADHQIGATVPKEYNYYLTDEATNISIERVLPDHHTCPHLS